MKNKFGQRLCPVKEIWCSKLCKLASKCKLRKELLNDEWHEK